MSRVNISKRLAVIASMAILALGLAACGSGDDGSTTGGSEGEGPSASIRIDGSSAVAPLTEAVAEQFMAKHPDVRITAGIGGGGAGHKSIHVATDALTLIVNSELYVFCLSLDQLAAIWGPDSKIERWNQVPGVDKETLGLEEEITEELALFGPGPGSGSFDFFTKAINGKEGAIRKDYNDVGEDDEAAIDGVESSPGGIGYVSFSSYGENANRVTRIDVDNGAGCVMPTVETAQEGSYAPLTRPLFIYPSDKALRKPEVREFVEYYLENVTSIAKSAGFVPLTEKQLAESKKAAEKAGL